MVDPDEIKRAFDTAAKLHARTPAKDLERLNRIGRQMNAHSDTLAKLQGAVVAAAGFQQSVDKIMATLAQPGIQQIAKQVEDILPRFNAMIDMRSFTAFNVLSEFQKTGVLDQIVPSLNHSMARALQVAPAGIPSAEAFGTPTVVQEASESSAWRVPSIDVKSSVAPWLALYYVYDVLTRQFDAQVFIVAVLAFLLACAQAQGLTAEEMQQGYDDAINGRYGDERP